MVTLACIVSSVCHFYGGSGMFSRYLVDVISCYCYSVSGGCMVGGSGFCKSSSYLPSAGPFD